MSEFKNPAATPTPDLGALPRDEAQAKGVLVALKHAAGRYDRFGDEESRREMLNSEALILAAVAALRARAEAAESDAAFWRTNCERLTEGRDAMTPRLREVAQARPVHGESAAALGVALIPPPLRPVSLRGVLGLVPRQRRAGSWALHTSLAPTRRSCWTRTAGRPWRRTTTMPDCGDNSCMYRDRTKPGGMRTNGGCRCDACPACGEYYRRWKPGVPQHYSWCAQPGWIPEHHRPALDPDGYTCPEIDEALTKVEED